jgi:hypothetical protein
MAELFPISLADQIACAERELKMRRQVYPRRVGNRLMRQEHAEREIATMEAIIETLRGLKND